MVTVDGPKLADFGRFSDPALSILISLAEGPKHGYAMMVDIEALSGTKLGPGTLYGAIARLERAGWIAPLPEEERRRPYDLTAVGRQVLAQQLAALKSLLHTGLDRLALS